MTKPNKFQSDEVTKSEILQVHDQFWQALGDRDIEARFSFCDDNVTFIGTGLNEKAANKAEYMAINRKGLEQYPHKFNINFLWKQVSFLDDLAWVESEVEWEIVLDELMDKENIRSTVVMKRNAGIWKIVHVHGSVPDYRYTGQNYMSTNETHRKNRELEMEVYKRTKELNQALEHLKNTQSQLIQSEKMASLGELTAGIAHEIQNPLNFVNNFSEVSIELIDELKQESAVSGQQSAVGGQQSAVGGQQSAVGGQQSAVSGQQSAVEIMDDIKQNLEKILHHGKRADAIVKGMLQHSRTSTGQKELTDINELADEYLRLAYHGLRAKDKDFNATLNTDFDKSIGNINIIPQDIGRVILNLITNAFYAVDEKKKQLASDLSALSNLTGQNVYEPTVTVTTRKTGGRVEISVKDNGNGIPQKILDKIFQPFFTTKPTGQGTGLGLSLSYDIVKAHGGELKVETKEARPDDPVGRGEGTEFIIHLPE